MQSEQDGPRHISITTFIVDNLHWITLIVVLVMICIMAILVLYLLKRRKSRSRAQSDVDTPPPSDVNQCLKMSDSSDCAYGDEGIVQENEPNDTLIPNIEGISV